MSNPMEYVTVVSQKSDIFAAVADALVAAVQEQVATNGLCTIALSGGSTPRGLHELLCTEAYRDQIDWSKVHLFWGDERSVPPEHADSNYRMAKESLLDPLAIPESQIHRYLTELGVWEEVASRCQQDIANVTGCTLSGPLPRFGIILLGMGDDGHTASLFPETTALNESTAWVVANHVPQLDTHRITFSARLINAAHHVWFMAAGENKASRLAEVLLGPKDPHRLPSQLICPDGGQLRWFVDSAAAAELPSFNP